MDVWAANSNESLAFSPWGLCMKINISSEANNTEPAAKTCQKGLDSPIIPENSASTAPLTSATGGVNEAATEGWSKTPMDTAPVASVAEGVAEVHTQVCPALEMALSEPMIPKAAARPEFHVY